MRGRVRQIITTPKSEETDQVTVSKIINISLLTVMGGISILLFFLFAFSNNQIYIVMLFLILISSVLFKVLLNRGYLRTVSLLLVSLTWLIVTAGAVNTIGIYAPANSAYLIVIVLSSVLFGKRTPLYAAVGCSLSGLAIVSGMQAGFITMLDDPIIPMEIEWGVYSIIYLMVGVVIYQVSQVVERSNLATQRISLELRQSTDYLKQAETLAHLGNFEFDIESQIVNWSDETYRIFGLDVGSPINLRTYQNLVPEEAYHRVMLNVRQTVDTGKPYELEHPIIDSNGIRKELYVIGDPIFNQTGQVIKVFGIIQDITERKRAEQIQQALLNISRSRHETDNLFALLQYTFEQLGGLINVSNCYVALYDEKTEMYSFPYGFDVSINDWSPQKLTGGLTDYVRRTKQPQILTEAEQKNLIAQSKLKPLGNAPKIWLGAPLKIKQRVIGVIVIQDYEDKDAYRQSDLDLLTYVAENIASVIDSKRAENERIELQMQKQNNDFLQEFVGHMTHDLKTPLSVIKNSTYLLSNVKEPSRQIEFIERINYQLERLDRMIEDILTISHLDHIEYPSQSLINLNDLLKHVTQQMYPKMQRKNIQLNLDLAPILPVILGSEGDLTRALLNLLENATNYNEEDGKIIIRSYVQDDVVVCEISDTGIGIKSDDLSHIFERFYRADNARDFERGTGLGLAIVSRVVELHKGSIDVSSKLGEGTKFTIRLAHHHILQHTSSRSVLNDHNN